LLYRPLNLTLWDTLLYEDGGTYHLFFLQQHGLGHAVSTDLCTWTPAADIDLRGRPGDWNEAGGPLTGFIVEHEGLHHLFAGALAPGSGESVYGVFTSRDLVAWEPHPANPVLRAPASFGHDRTSTRDWGMFNAWRDPFILRGDDGRYHAYLCARSGPWTEGSTGSVIAHASSADLISWEHHEPLFETDRVKYTEVPGLFELDGRHYLHFLDHGWGGLRIHTPSRDDSAGTYYAVAARAEGPYAWPADPLLIGSGHDRTGAWAARTIDYDGGQLLYHHVVAARPAFGSLKRIRARPDGTLYLEYFPAIESLEVGEARHGAAGWQEREDDVGVWTASADGLSGLSRVVGSSAILARDRSDLHLECTVRLNAGARAGVVVRAAGIVGARESATGVVVSLDVELQQARIEVLDCHPFEGWGLSAADVTQGGRERERDSVRLPLELGRPYALRCLARAEFFDVYLDDVWLFSRALTSAAAAGDVELMVERGQADFSGLRLAALPPLP
jgi:beta-fructofuranosidase